MNSVEAGKFLEWPPIDQPQYREKIICPFDCMCMLDHNTGPIVANRVYRCASTRCPFRPKKRTPDLFAWREVQGDTG